MSTMALSDVPQVRREFLIDVMFAENYELGHLDDLGPSVKNPVVERLLPSLLHVKAVAILDHAIRSWCDHKGLVIPKKPYGTDLKGRIDYLVDNAFLSDRSSLHAIRGTRNIVAHEPADAVDWRQLDSDVKAIHVALKELGLVGEFPKWEICLSVRPRKTPGFQMRSAPSTIVSLSRTGRSWSRRSRGQNT
jgi:hypothetical protein